MQIMKKARKQIVLKIRSNTIIKRKLKNEKDRCEKTQRKICEDLR